MQIIDDNDHGIDGIEKVLVPDLLLKRSSAVAKLQMRPFIVDGEDLCSTSEAKGTRTDLGRIEKAVTAISGIGCDLKIVVPENFLSAADLERFQARYGDRFYTAANTAAFLLQMARSADAVILTNRCFDSSAHADYKDCIIRYIWNDDGRQQPNVVGLFVQQPTPEEILNWRKQLASKHR